VRSCDATKSDIENLRASQLREAQREGAAAIELVDLDGPITLLSELKLGVTTRTDLAIDHKFFDDYMPSDE
jgi:hypothetical protein